LTTCLFRFRTIHDLLNLRGKAVERFVDIDIILGGDLEKRNTEFVSQFLSLLGRYRSLFFPVTFVADKDLMDAFAGMLLDV
jgi:hypothetical protein